MNSNPLSRHCLMLTPWERLPLIVAASARADVVEKDRLARSAPQNSFRVPDYWGLAEGFKDLAQLYLIQQLDLAAFYWECMAVLESAPPSNTRASRHTQQREKRLGKEMKMLAYRYIIRADGWKLLCAELRVASDFLVAGMPGYQAVQHMEQVARPLAFTAEQAIAYLRRMSDIDQPAQEGTTAGQRVYRISTADDVAQAMKEFLSERLDAWC